MRIVNAPFSSAPGLVWLPPRRIIIVARAGQTPIHECAEWTPLRCDLVADVELAEGPLPPDGLTDHGATPHLRMSQRG